MRLSQLKTEKRRVVVMHDGSIDEYMATMLLFTMSEIQVDGIVIVAGNCLSEVGMQAAYRVQQYLGCKDVSLTLSSARGYNPFPWEYRTDCIKQCAVDALQRLPNNPAWPPFPSAELWLESFFSMLMGKVTIICLGPLTALTALLVKKPDVALKIEELIWMGGAIDVPGNLDPTTLPPLIANEYAEWNAFWDPYAVEYIFRETVFPVLLFPLDLTNAAKVSSDFLSSLMPLAKCHRLADLAYQSYRAVSGAYYSMWDVATVAYLGIPNAYEDPISLTLEVTTEGESSGSIRRSIGGRSVRVVKSFKDIGKFYDYVLKQFSE